MIVFPQTDASIHALASGTPLLTTLEIASCPQLTDSMSSLALSQNSFVEYLNYLLTDGLGALARGCRHLSRLDLEEVVLVTDSTVHALANHCPLLTTLTLSHCP